MEDTQRSQTISTNNQGIALQTVHDSNVIFKDSVEGDNPLILAGGSSLARVRILAQENPEMVFTSLAHRINMGLLRDSYKE
ncbi:MAG: group II intron reverse transcriptase/maturase, partial [Gammaproteobacteria bacterium]|nr:group II intron reverse transcriptase/maturase [Gammaproteobacteria bacterium]